MGAGQCLQSRVSPRAVGVRLPWPPVPARLKPGRLTAPYRPTHACPSTLAQGLFPSCLRPGRATPVDADRSLVPQDSRPARANEAARATDQRLRRDAQGLGTKGRGSAPSPSARPPMPTTLRMGRTGTRTASIAELVSAVRLLACRDARPGPASRLPRSRCASPTCSANSDCSGTREVAGQR